MKIGVRKPSIKKSISARTTGRATRSVKRAVNPMYGKKGMGWVNDPKKAAYNKVYNKTTVPVKDLVENDKTTIPVKDLVENDKINESISSEDIIYGIVGIIAIIIIIFVVVFFLYLVL